MPLWSLKLALRHLWAARSRSALRWMNAVALLGLLIGVFAWTVVMSVMTGLQEEQRQRLLAQSAHLLWEGTPRRDLGPALDSLRKNPELHKIDALLQTEGLLSLNEKKQRGRSRGSGVVIQGDDTLAPGTAVAGAELAATLDLQVSDQVSLHSPWRLEALPLELQLRDTRVTGIYEVDRSSIWVARKDLENWLGLAGAVSRVELQLKDPLQAEGLRPQLEKALGVPLKTWRELHASLWYSLRLEKLVMGLAVFFVLLLAAMAVHVSMAVRVAEKAREIGVLRALGAPPRALLRLYTLEAFLLGSIGSGAGLWSGWVFCRILASGEWLRLPDFFYSTNIPVVWSWAQNLGLASFAVLLAVVAAYFPVRRALDVEIQEALR